MYRGSVAYQSYFVFKLATRLQCMLTLAVLCSFIFYTIYSPTRSDNDMLIGLEFIFVLIFTLLSINSLALSSKMISWKSTTILLVHQIYVITYIIFLLAGRMILYYFAIALFNTRGMRTHFIDAKRDRTRESAVAHRNTYPSFDASGPEPVLKVYRKSPDTLEDQMNNHCVGYTSEPVLKSFRKLSHLLHDQLKGPPDAPKLAMERMESPSAEDYLDFEPPKPSKPHDDAKKEKRNGSFDDVLAELTKRQAKLQKY